MSSGTTMASRKAGKSKMFETGLDTRKTVLGPDYVKRQFQDPDDFAAPFQEVATEYAWGAVWSPPGLSLRDRSLVTLAQCIALNRPNEVRIHLRGAVRNGITRAELQELCLHSR
jgi:4-carboxymuconolactone decarboxylase